MKKILIVSDSHNSIEEIKYLFRKEKEFDTVIHLGDHEESLELIKKEAEYASPLCGFLSVSGNCDEFSIDPETRTAEFNYNRIFMTHGHIYRVHDSLETLSYNARMEMCGIALFGHTHRPLYQEVNGVICFNPGSVHLPKNADRRPTYGVMMIDTEGRVTLEHRYVYDLIGK